MVFLIERGKLVVEGAGAAGVAGADDGGAPPAPTGTTVAILSGGNVDASVLATVINRHQTGIGRRTRVFSRISDRPGGLVDFLQNVAAAGGNVLDVTHVRDGVPLHLRETGVEVLVECRSEEHREDLLARLRSSGYEVEELGERSRMLRHVVIWSMVAGDEGALDAVLEELRRCPPRSRRSTPLSAGPLLNDSESDAVLCVDLADRGRSRALPGPPRSPAGSGEAARRGGEGAGGRLRGLSHFRAILGGAFHPAHRSAIPSDLRPDLTGSPR